MLEDVTHAFQFMHTRSALREMQIENQGTAAYALVSCSAR